MSLINDALKRAKQAQQSDAPPPVRHALKPVDTLQRRTPWPKYLIPALIVILLIGADFLIYSWWKGRSHDTASTSVAAATPASEARKSPSLPAILPQVAPAPVQQPVIKPKDAPVRSQPIPPIKPTPVSISKAHIENPSPQNNQTRTESKPQTVVAVQPKVAQSIPAGAPTSSPQSSPAAIKPVLQPAPAVSAVKPPATSLPQKVEFPPFQLQGIFYLPSRPSAVVNGRTVVVGEQIGEARVQAIDQRSVKIEYKGQVKVLWLQ